MKRKNKEYHFTFTLNDVNYTFSIFADNKNNNKYSCTLFDNTNVRTRDRFKLIHNIKDNCFWAWTGDLLTQVEKKEMRIAISEMFNSEELKITA